MSNDCDGGGCGCLMVLIMLFFLVIVFLRYSHEEQMRIIELTNKNAAESSK